MSEFVNEDRTAEKNDHPKNSPKIPEKRHKAIHLHGCFF
jgi:hypothetical protein